MAKKIFKDLLGRIIRKGDVVLNIWAKTGLCKTRGDGGDGTIQWRICQVDGFTDKSVRLLYKDPNKHLKKPRKINIYNNENRIIVIKESAIVLDTNASNKIIERLKNNIQGQEQELIRIKQILSKTNSKNNRLIRKVNNRLIRKVDELQEHIAEEEKARQRFDILDFGTS